MIRIRTRLPLAAAAATGAAVLIAAPAWAHIHTDPSAIQAGKEATVGFIVEHGCDGSPTTKMEIQLPEGATGISGVDADGFTATVDGQIVTFAGGSLPDETEHAFEVTFTAPEDPGEVPVKIIQTCEEGSTDWIEETVDGEEEPEHPAPVLTITEGAPTGEEGDHHEEAGDDDHDEEASSTTAGESDHHEEEEEATTTTAASTETTTTVAVGGAGDASDGGDDDGSNTGLLVGIGALVVAGGAGGVYAFRKTRTPFNRSL